MKKYIYIIIFNFFCVVDDHGGVIYIMSDSEDDIDDAMDTPSGSGKKLFYPTRKTEAAWIIHSAEAPVGSPVGEKSKRNGK